MKVLYFQVRDASTKLKRVVATATKHFEKKEPLLILAPNQAAVEYLDLLLWRTPEESFLPHHAGRETTSELIAITDQAFNTNQATAVFNLTLEPIPLSLDPQLIYELEDLSSEETQEAFKKKFTTYHEKNFAIQSA